MRELRNVVGRALLLSPGDVVESATVARALPQVSAGSMTGAGNGLMASGPLAQRVEAFERETLLAELKRNLLFIRYRSHITDVI